MESTRLLPSFYTLIADVSCRIKRLLTSTEKSVTKHLKIIFCGIFTQIIRHTKDLKHYLYKNYVDNIYLLTYAEGTTQFSTNAVDTFLSAICLCATHKEAAFHTLTELTPYITASSQPPLERKKKKKLFKLELQLIKKTEQYIY